MSDYVHKKVIRYPLQELMDRFNTKDGYDCEDALKTILGRLYNRKQGFEIECTDKRWYLDFVYYSTYGESSGDFGNVRLASKNEFNLLCPYLEKIFNEDILESKLRAVEYSYYNCCECTDYYDLPDSNDDSGKIREILNNKGE